MLMRRRLLHRRYLALLPRAQITMTSSVPTHQPLKPHWATAGFSSRLGSPTASVLPGSIKTVHSSHDVSDISAAVNRLSTSNDKETQAETERLQLKNQLSISLSPYVRGHSSNPVAWQLWNDESLALAKRYDRLIFLSIGYAACHWCHVMERESFENEEVAKLLNDNFIPIKVDREERPDIDRIYMNFVQATKGSGGWPLNVFITPDLQPIFGGTYWPGPSASIKGQLGFLEVLKKIIQVWKDEPQKCLESARETTKQLQEFADEGLKITTEEPKDGLELDLLEEAYQYFLTRFDSTYGGFGFAPKFPTPVNLAFLLRLGKFPKAVEDVVGDVECEHAKFMALATLKNMAKGGINDHIEHGFARYSVTPDWSLPHFEKMLYDQAQLLGVYFDAYLVSKDQEMLDVAFDIADYICVGALRNPEGGFFSSEDADSFYRATDTEKREGAFYVWTLKEFENILGDSVAAICAEYWNVHADGNVEPENDPHDDFINQNVLSVVSTIPQLSKKFGLPESDIKLIIYNARKKLVQHKIKERPRPSLDDKIVTAWNGLAISSLARGAAVLEYVNVEKSKMFRTNAESAANFIRKHLYNEDTGILKRVYGGGRVGEIHGFADDYAFMTMGLISLYEATFETDYLSWAARLQDKQIELFWDERNGGFFSTAKDAADMILRLKDGLDSQEPSTNGISASNLFKLSTLLNSEVYGKHAKLTCEAFTPELLQHPFLLCSLLGPVVASNLGMRSVVLIGDPTAPEISIYKKKLREKLLSNTVVLQIIPELKELEKESTKWLLNNTVLKELVDMAQKRQSKVLVQICEGSRCLLGDGNSELGGKTDRQEYGMDEIAKVVEELG